MSETISADMSANVWKVLVAAGDTVEEGDTLMILESMKMEIPVVSEVSGKVVEVHVAEGGMVNAGDALASVDED